MRVGFLREPFSGERLCRRSLSSPSARTVRDTALAALGAAAVTRTGAPTKQLDLDAERATRFCDWIGRVAMGSEGQRTVADEHGRETRAGVPASRKPYDLKFPFLPWPAVDGSHAGNLSVRDAGAGARLTCATEALRDAVRDAMMSLTTYGRSRAVARVV